MAAPQLHIHTSGDEVQTKVCDMIAEVAKKSVEDHGFFSVGLSGGSVSKYVSQGFRTRGDVDWHTWRVFFCDERHVPFSSDDSTYAFFKQELFDHIPLPAENIFAIEPSLDVSGAAEDYIQKIKQVHPTDSFPSFDLLILGMGPDGHTCSLFPGHPGLQETEKLVIPITDSPKPPSSRITLTIPVLNQARNIFVVATGSSKVDAVKGSLEPSEGQDPLPAGLVRPVKGELHWFMDTGAAAKLNNK